MHDAVRDKHQLKKFHRPDDSPENFSEISNWKTHKNPNKNSQELLPRGSESSEPLNLISIDNCQFKLTALENIIFSCNLSA